MEIKLLRPVMRAASYIVDHLNVGDKFNIVDFSSQALLSSPTSVGLYAKQS
ncbi:MAG: hypothetical protein R3B93_00920 [Bacteroidia bacterium]